MEVRVKANLVRSGREERGWSQDHLASVAGLSLRTIQRIEKTGSASFESVTALASVLDVSVADLRVNEPEPSRARTTRVSLELPMRLALAAVSGVLCGIHYLWSRNSGWPSFEWLDFGIAGALFGIAVLCPYLKAGRGWVARALGLIGASALSYFCAVSIALNADSWLPVSSSTSFLLASLVGVAIVRLAARILIPLRVTAAFWLPGLAASLVGGATMYAGFEILGSTTSSTIASFCVWHLLACLAIHCGCQPDDAQEGLLATVARTRGRFSIVPGWQRVRHPSMV